MLARLRHQRGFSLNELNRSLRTLLVDLNQRPFKKLPGSRASALVDMDQPALRALPLKVYEYAEWKLASVGVDHHVDADDHSYSVPCQHARQQVGARLSSQLRSTFKGRHTTIDQHMPPAHRAMAGVSAESPRSHAAVIGPRTEALGERLLHQRRHPQQAFRSRLGMLQLSRQFGSARLEAACARALKHNVVSWRSLQSSLKHGLDQQALA